MRLDPHKLFAATLVILGTGGCFKAWGPCGTLAESPPSSCFEKQGPIALTHLVEDSVYGFLEHAGPFTVSIGDTARLRIRGLLYVQGIAWGSTDESTATVKATQRPPDRSVEARVAGKRAGTTTIWVTGNGQRDSVMVTVRPQTAAH